MSSVVPQRQTGKEYWRSLDDLADTPEFQAFMEREFPNYASESISASTRRQFLKVMGASLALAGLTSCRWPEEKIAPFAKRPQGRKPGIPQYFATTLDRGRGATGLVVESFDGRPIKIEGNLLHPESRGAADLQAQAALLDLYDPDRSRRIVHRQEGQEVVKTWDDFLAVARERFAAARQNKGKGLYILAEASSSPTFAAQRRRLQAGMPDAVWVQYDPFAYSNEEAALRDGDSTYRPRVDFTRAQVVVCLDADPLMTGPGALAAANDFAKSRRPDDGRMNRLYAFENNYTITGAMADHRYAVAASAIPAVAAHLAAQLAVQGGDDARAAFQAFPALERFYELPDSLADLPAIARDLLDHAGACAVVAGPRQPPEVHALVHLVNQALGAAGGVVVYDRISTADSPRGAEAIQVLVDAIQRNEVDTLLILGGNPVYTAPADLALAERLGEVNTSVHLALYDDETSRLCTWHLPQAHFLESWGDARALDGTHSIVQPLIAPLYNGKTPIELAELALTGDDASGYDLVRRTFKETLGETAFETNWRKALHDGLVEGSAAQPAVPPASLRLEFLATALESLKPGIPVFTRDNLEVTFRPDLCVGDGRQANNGWLQELPDPITKLTWDNAALIAPATARELNLTNGDMITLAVADRSMDLPVFLMPGQAAFSLTIPVGFGRTASGNVGTGVGFDTYRLRTVDLARTDIATGATFTPTGRSYTLGSTQDHHAIDTLGLKERAQRSVTLLREVDLQEFLENPEAVEELGIHYPHDVQLFDRHEFDGHKWGMAIDLNVCIGCNACAAACQAENNVPIVGKEQILENREMHWLRVDRYFRGDETTPHSVHQPLMCVHCENAPCEQVCPVAATVHTEEGLNMMVYNRCVGTRYCSNNCPYKVRRFNYFNYHRKVPVTQQMMYNPEVTIRSRGVMEKCSYCVQRIEAVKIESKNERRAIRDGEIQTACQQTCPTQAIVFGDLSDPESRVSKLHKHARAYKMLGELLTEPRTRYLARLRNPNPALRGETHEPESGSHS